mmetsp:Transcript_3570/g.6739  ORF Transcript_3570/g.6739 Transcript_3570/m.6739 type:complete len:269 (+) Transcript_3570:632-1438(+)
MCGMWGEARRFFSLSDERKLAAGGSMQSVQQGVGVIGYGRMPDHNEFLEMRVGPGHVLEPASLCSELPGFEGAMLAARGTLFRVAAAVVGSAEREVRFRAGALRSLMDDGSLLQHGEVSSSQQRLCHYASPNAVPFEAHTDTTFATIIPVSAVAGLEVHNAEQGWVRPEAACQADTDGGGGLTVVVMAGELLQLLTCGYFPAAVHRVTRGSDMGRVSAPLLVRGRWQHRIRTGDLCTNDIVRDELREMDGMECRELHNTLVRRIGLYS